MFMLFIILTIIAIGLILTVLELFFIPGTTIVGLLGVIFSIAGIIITFRYFGSDIGFVVLASTTAAKIGVLYWSFHYKAWSRFSLKSAIRSKVNEGMTEGLTIGQTGTALSTLRPFGKAQINNREYEVKTLSGRYVDTGAQIIIKDISSNQIIVEPTP
jgi:membrane-bound ClpP family serine protease